MKDILLAFNEFASKIAEAMNEKDIVAEKGNYSGAVLVVVVQETDEKSPRMPIGGSLNWDPKSGKWTVDQQLQMPEPLRKEDAPSASLNTPKEDI